MMRFRKYLAIILALFLLFFGSCKAKYLEIEAAYNKARQKKTELEKESRSLKTENKELKEELNVLIVDYQDLQDFSSQILQIEKVKQDFLAKRLEYYLELKKIQKITPQKRGR